jgi:acyl carrier protein
MNDIKSVVFETIARTASVDVSSLRHSSTLKELGIPSLDAIEMLFELEEKFNLQLGDRDVDLGTATAADLVAAIEQALARKAVPTNAMRAAGAT